MASKKTSISSSSSGDGGGIPSITIDPRFLAARKLVSSGRALEGPAVEMLATLLEESRRVYGDSDIQTAA